MNEETTCCRSAANENTAVTTCRNEAKTFVEPTWNVTRHEEGATIEVSLPGVRKDDLKLEVRGTRLILEASRSGPVPAGRLLRGAPAPEGYRLELRLGNTLDGGALEARLDAGLLKLAVPLVQAARPKRIEIA